MARAASPNGRRILIVEDEALISVMLSDDLRDEGYVVLGPYSRCADAVASLRKEQPDLAVLDYMLRDGPCTELAINLRGTGVPFVIFSAYDRDCDKLGEFDDVPWLDKPVSVDALLRTLAALPVTAPQA